MMKANDILQAGMDAMADRAAKRDRADGERSMKRAVEIYSAWTGQEFCEGDGWRFMVALKMAREYQGAVHADDYVDGAAYFALLGEHCIVKHK